MISVFPPIINVNLEGEGEGYSDQVPFEGEGYGDQVDDR